MPQVYLWDFQRLNHSALPPEQPSPRRMIAINQDLGFIPKLFFPKGEGREYELSSYLERIACHRDQFTVFSGLSHPGVDGGHRADKSFLTAAPHPGRASFRNTISLDQLMANEVGHETRFRSFSLSINDSRSLSYTQAGVEIPTIKSASELYKKMFLQGDQKAIEGASRTPQTPGQYSGRCDGAKQSSKQTRNHRRSGAN